MYKISISVLTLFLAFAPARSAEEFNGTLQWSMRIEFIDPDVVAQMNQAQALLQNPELRALLLQTPSLRGMIEDKLGPLDATSRASSLLPTGFTLQIKGSRALLKTHGGLASREVLTLADHHAAYTINRTARTYEKLPAAISTVKIKVTRTPDTAPIVGYNCRRSIVEADDNGAKSRFSVWTTTVIKGLDSAALKRLNWGPLGGADFLGQIEGVPLKIEGTTPDLKVALMATQITLAPVASAVVSLPAGFKEVKSASH